MGIEIQMSGSGELGELAPGWNVQEYATPLTIGDTAGGTGSVSFSASARDDSLFIINNDIVTLDDTLGSIKGVVKTVSQNGLNVSVTHNTQLSLFDANFDIPALGAGGIYPAVDLCAQLVGRNNLCLPTAGYFYSLGGHSAGFDHAGTIAKSLIHDSSYLAYDNITGKYYPVYYREQYGSIWADTFTIINNEIYARHITGDCFSNSPAIPTSRLAFKTVLTSGVSTSWGFSSFPDDSNTGSGADVGFTIDPTTGMLSFGGYYHSGGTRYNFSQNLNLASSLNITQQLAIFIEYTRPVTGNTYTIKITACNTSDYTTTVSITQTITADTSYYNGAWSLSGNVQSLYRDQGKYSTSFPIAEYEGVENYTVTGTIAIDGPVPAQTNANVWEYLQQACAAFGREIAIVGTQLVVRDVGAHSVDISNTEGPITITPTMTLGGRNVEIVYSNAHSIVNQELYNARDDSNRIISVKAEETITTTVPISGTPTVVNLPARSLSSTGVINAGEYAISDSKGVQVPQRLWSYYGGKVQVVLSTTAPNAIDIIVSGPTSTDGVFNGTTPAYTSPYKLAYSSGTAEYAALSVTGSGIRTNPQTLKLQTAADPLKTAQDVSKTITNQFIVSKMQAYDRGLNAAIEAAGPKVVISGNVPNTAAASFGMIAGSLIRYRNSIYRVNDATIGNLGISFNASRHVTVAEFDAIWNGHTVGAHDLTWLGYDAADHVIEPFRFVGDNESVLMFLDTDINPYYDFTGDPEISVFPDTDMNPFYEDGGNLNGEDPVYLDVDDNPYDGGSGHGS